MGVRSRTLTQYESYLRTICEQFGPWSINEIRRGEIEDWLSEMEWSKRTRNNYISTLSTLFIFARDHDYCAENPAERVPLAILDDAPPGIRSVNEAAAMLDTAKTEDPENALRPQTLPENPRINAYENRNAQAHIHPQSAYQVRVRGV